MKRQPLPTRKQTFELLERVLQCANVLDAELTKQGRGRCNGVYAGNIRDHSCPLCEAQVLVDKLRRMRPAIEQGEMMP